MAEKSFMLEPYKWFAMQVVQPSGGTMEKENYYSPVLITSLNPQKTGRGVLEVELIADTGRTRMSLKVVSRKEHLIAVVDDETKVVILSHISWEWLHHHCPKYFQGKLSDNESRSDLDYFLDVSLNLPIHRPEYENFREKEIRFFYKAESWPSLTGVNIPLMIYGKSFLQMYDEVTRRIRFYLPEIDLKKVPVYIEPKFDADEILTACALRFDGYKYGEAYHKEPNLDSVPAEPLDQLHTFFILQRYLYKWGGEREPRNGKVFKLFQELFLLLSRRPIPIEFMHLDSYQQWIENYEPFIEQAETVVRKRHEATEYV